MIIWLKLFFFVNQRELSLVYHTWYKRWFVFSLPIMYTGFCNSCLKLWIPQNFSYRVQNFIKSSKLNRNSSKHCYNLYNGFPFIHIHQICLNVSSSIVVVSMEKYKYQKKTPPKPKNFSFCTFSTKKKKK